MKLEELLEALIEHNKTNRGYQVHLNSGNLEEDSNKQSGVEFGDLYFTSCSTLQNTAILTFGNENRKPISNKEDGTPLFPSEINSRLYIDLTKIEAIEDVDDYEDWFEFPSSRLINLYMLQENDTMTGHRNVLTIGFMD